MRVSRIQAEENRQNVINAASRLFRERGFDGIGLKDLMEVPFELNLIVPVELTGRLIRRPSLIPAQQVDLDSGETAVLELHQIPEKLQPIRRLGGGSLGCFLGLGTGYV